MKRFIFVLSLLSVAHAKDVDALRKDVEKLEREFDEKGRALDKAVHELNNAIEGTSDRFVENSESSLEEPEDFDLRKEVKKLREDVNELKKKDSRISGFPQTENPQYLQALGLYKEAEKTEGPQKIEIFNKSKEAFSLALNSLSEDDSLRFDTIVHLGKISLALKDFESAKAHFLLLFEDPTPSSLQMEARLGYAEALTPEKRKNFLKNLEKKAKTENQKIKFEELQNKLKN